MKFGIKGSVGMVVMAILVIVGMTCMGQIIETNKDTTYQVKQAAITGAMSAKMTPGMWLQNFGTIKTWPKAETIFFTTDKDTTDDVNDDTSMAVRFVDGSNCKISGTGRILLPSTESDAIALVVEDGYVTYQDAEEKLLKPTIRKVLRHTANMMTATESFKEKRGAYISMCVDQLENGLYKTTTVRREVIDLVSGDKVWKEVSVVKTDGKGLPMYEMNALAGTGIKIKNFEVKSFNYDPKVRAQIMKQQEAQMAVQTAKANAQLAEQNKITIEAQGKARVATAEYLELEKKATAIVQAQRDKEMAIIKSEKQKEMASIAKEEAIINGERRKEVASLDAQTAKEEKKANILRGEGEATRKKLVMQADGALQQKLSTYERVNANYAKAIQGYQGNWVPTTVMGGAGEEVNGATALINMLSVKTAKDLALTPGITK